MSARELPVPLACRECGADVVVGADAVRCTRGHELGRSVDGVLDLRRDRDALGAELVAFWEASPDYYDRAHDLNVQAYVHHPPHRRLVDAVAGARRVLDVGCGSGDFALALAGRGEVEYVGVDVSLGALRAARLAGVPGAFLAADATCLPFADGAFDAVVSLYALEHFVRPREALVELCRVLRPGGVLGVLAMRYDRPLGTIPSVRLGLPETPRLHPANVAVYAANRTRFALRQLAKHVRYALDAGYTSFERIERPLVLEGRYEADLDAVHVVSGVSVVRLLRAQGLRIEHTNVDERPLRLRVPVGLEVVARKLDG